MKRRLGLDPLDRVPYELAHAFGRRLLDVLRARAAHELRILSPLLERLLSPRGGAAKDSFEYLKQPHDVQALPDDAPSYSPRQTAWRFCRNAAIPSWASCASALLVITSLQCS